jgi:heptosyltransferase-2
MRKKYIYLKKRYIILFSIIDFIGTIVFSIARYFKKSGKNLKIKKIAVFELAHLGDVIAITAALRLLRKKFPDSLITVVVSHWAKEIITANPDIDEIITYRASWFDRKGKSFSLAESISFVNFLSRGSFDLGIDMRGDARVILLMWLGKIKRRIGYGFSGLSFLLTDIVPFNVSERQDKHQIEHNLNLIASISDGLPCRERDMSSRIFFSKQDSLYVNKLLKDNGINENDFLIALHPGAGISTKCWPVENFLSLAEKILKQYAVKAVLLGGQNEADLSKVFQPLFGSSFIDLSGRTNIKQLAALLKRCNLFIGGDSGVMHVAATQDTPIVAIWGGQNKPEHWRPLQENAVVIHKPVNCSPCGLSRCKTLKCLRSISVEDVLGAVGKQLERYGHLK